MTNLTSTIDTALEVLKADSRAHLIDSYTRAVRSTFSALVVAFGPELKGIYNSRSAHTFRAIRGSVGMQLKEGETLARPGSTVWVIREDLLSENAARYADTAIAAWAGKIVEKVGEDFVFGTTRMDARGDLTVTGQRGEEKVTLIQQRVTKVSPKGVVFCQWPARIYVNGKMTTEALYHRGA